MIPHQNTLYDAQPTDARSPKHLRHGPKTLLSRAQPGEMVAPPTHPATVLGRYSTAFDGTGDTGIGSFMH